MFTVLVAMEELRSKGFIREIVILNLRRLGSGLRRRIMCKIIQVRVNINVSNCFIDILNLSGEIG